MTDWKTDEQVINLDEQRDIILARQRGVPISRIKEHHATYRAIRANLEDPPTPEALAERKAIRKWLTDVGGRVPVWKHDDLGSPDITALPIRYFKASR